MESLDSRLGLLDEQMGTFSVAEPETDELVRKVKILAPQKLCWLCSA